MRETSVYTRHERRNRRSKCTKMVGLPTAIENGGYVEAVKRLLGMYLILVATAVAVWFVINTFFVDSFSVSDVWYVLDILMVIGLAVGLAFNFDRKRRMDGRSPGEAITRSYLEVNIAFYLTAGITILFLHSWFSFLYNGPGSLDGNHQAWVIWAVVDTMIPLMLGTTGCAMLKGSPDS